MARIVNFLLDKSPWLQQRVADETFLKWQYLRELKKPLNLDPPKTFNEKIQWLKLHWRKDILTQCADKYEVRQFVEARGGADILKKLYGVWERAEDIDPAQLPEQFVFKVNHGCRQQIICRDKAEMDWRATGMKLNKFLQRNRFSLGREWSYKNISPRIFCEEFLEPLLEYNFFCFNGTPQIIEVVADQLGDTLAEMRDANWKSFGRKYLIASGFPAPPQKPARFDLMWDCAAKLSAGFPFVRVDFLDCKDKVYFGEMTFYPRNGLMDLVPNSLDEHFGSLLELPEKI